MTDYLKLAVNDDFDALKNIINKPTRFLGAAFVKDVENAHGRNIIDKIQNVTAVAGNGRRRSQSQQDNARAFTRLLTALR